MHYNFSTLFTYAITVLSHLHSHTFIQLSFIFAFVKLFLSGTNAGYESCKNLTSGGACPHCTKISSRHSAETRVHITFLLCRLMNWFHWLFTFSPKYHITIVPPPPLPAHFPRHYPSSTTLYFHHFISTIY